MRAAEFVYPGSNERDWQSRANCIGVDPDRFFHNADSEFAAPAEIAETKKICGACAVRTECLDYALEHGEKKGIWGGFTEEERERL